MPRYRHRRKRRIPRDFFDSVEEWDEFIVNMKPGTRVHVVDGKLVVERFRIRNQDLDDMKDV